MVIFLERGMSTAHLTFVRFGWNGDTAMAGDFLRKYFDYRWAGPSSMGGSRVVFGDNSLHPGWCWVGRIWFGFVVDCLKSRWLLPAEGAFDKDMFLAIGVCYCRAMMIWICCHS